MIAGAIEYFAFDVAALAAAFHAVGSAGLPIGLLVLAYTLGHGGAMVPIPGSAEGGLIGMFVLYGMSLPTATAAVLAYRALHAGVPMLLGVIGLADVRRLLRDPCSPQARPAHGLVLQGPPDQVCAITSTTVSTASATPPTVKTPTVRNVERHVRAGAVRVLQLPLPLRPDDQQSHRQRRVAAAQQHVRPCARRASSSGASRPTPSAPDRWRPERRATTPARCAPRPSTCAAPDRGPSGGGSCGGGSSMVRPRVACRASRRAGRGGRAG